MTNQSLKFDSLSPILQFIKKSSFSSFLLFSSALLALILANTPANAYIQYLLNQKIGFSLGDFKVYKSLLLWINDGLMSIFFFVVGLELKREIIAGELSNLRNVIMPIAAAVGGMLTPALIYYVINFSNSEECLNGWGIPMATDIAFALGVLYLLGKKVPIQLKVFLTALAIIDDIGAVSIIAFFYTSEISVANLITGACVLSIMILLNKFGIRQVLPYAIFGIGGFWLAFLLSGVHATVAAVLAAFTIPANRSIDKEEFLKNLSDLKNEFEKAKSAKNSQYLLSAEEENIIGEIKRISNNAISPLQNLESSLHSFVLYIVMPIFALANAGIVIDKNWINMLFSPVAIGISIGLFLGKFIGIFGISYLGLKLGWFKMPENLNIQMLIGISFLAAIGFTMSLFINSLAFTNPIYIEQAKMGILSSSIVAGILGYFILKKAINK